MKLEKIYSVRFLGYTNCMNDTVSDWDGQGTPPVGKQRYLHVGSKPFLVREADLQFFQKYGLGFEDVHFVGNLGVLEAKDLLDAGFKYEPSDATCTKVTDVPVTLTEAPVEVIQNPYYCCTKYTPDPSVIVTAYNDASFEGHSKEEKVSDCITMEPTM